MSYNSQRGYQRDRYPVRRQIEYDEELYDEFVPRQRSAGVQQPPRQLFSTSLAQEPDEEEFYLLTMVRRRREQAVRVMNGESSEMPPPLSQGIRRVMSITQVGREQLANIDELDRELHAHLAQLYLVHRAHCQIEFETPAPPSIASPAPRISSHSLRAQLNEGNLHSFNNGPGQPALHFFPPVQQEGYRRQHSPHVVAHEDTISHSAAPHVIAHEGTLRQLSAARVQSEAPLFPPPNPSSYQDPVLNPWETTDLAPNTESLVNQSPAPQSRMSLIQKDVVPNSASHRRQIAEAVDELKRKGLHPPKPTLDYVVNNIETTANCPRCNQRRQQRQG